MIHEKVNNGEWKADDPRAIALHGLIGGIMAEINGGKFGDGLTTAAINKLVVAKLAESGLVDGAELRWISGLLGIALDGNQGAVIADSATRNNWLAPEHNKLLDELRNEISEEELANMKLGNKDADRIALQLGDEGHTIPPAESFYKEIRRAVEAGAISEEYGAQLIHEREQKALLNAEAEFVKRLEYAINYDKQGAINDSAAYWFVSAIHVIQDLEAHWRLGEDGGWGGHLLGSAGLGPSPDDPNYQPDRFERSKINTQKAWDIYKEALKTGYIDREKTKDLFEGVR